MDASERMVATIMYIGDLSTFASFREVDGAHLTLDPTVVRMETKLSNEQFEHLLQR